jgi:hypothetical protein
LPVTVESLGACLAAAELILYYTAAFAWCRSKGCTLSESLAISPVVVLMLISLVFQTAFLAGLPLLSGVSEVILTPAAFVVLARNRKMMLPAVSAIRRWCSERPLISVCLATAWGYLAGQAFLLPPSPLYWQPLSQVLQFQQHGTVFTPSAALLGDGSIGTPLGPLNALILPHLFLRFGSDLGVGLIGFTAYLSIVFSVYALSRRYAWPPNAFTAAVIVAAMPRLVLLATSPGYEILPAATALVCLLAVFRALESPNSANLWLLMTGLPFQIAGSAMDVVFAAVLVPLVCILLFRRHGFRTWWRLLAVRPLATLAILLAAGVFLQLGPIAHNLASGRSWLGVSAAQPLVFNSDGIQGAAANGIRYLLQSAHLTLPVEVFSRWAFGFTFTGLLQGIYDHLAAPLLGARGAAAVFRIFWAPDERVTWFGPLAFLLVLPAVLYALWRGPRRLKSLATALTGYLFLVLLIPAWKPENVRYFDVLFTCGGVCLAFLLPPWRLTRRGRRVLLVACSLLLGYAGLFNTFKPAVLWRPGFSNIRPAMQKGAVGADLKPLRRSGIPSNSIWRAFRWGRDRNLYAAAVFGDNRCEILNQKVSQTTTLWLVCRELQLAYPFLLHHRGAMLLPLEQVSTGGILRAADAGPLAVLFVDADDRLPALSLPHRFLWRADPSAARLPGALLRIP